jgi:hypothetical protein
MGFRRAAGLAALNILFLSGCGGGSGGGGGSAGLPEPSEPTVSIATHSVAASAGYADYAPLRTVVMTATNVPDDGLYVGVNTTNNGLASIDFNVTSATTADLLLQFRAPVDLDIGTVTDQVTVFVCLDDQCATQVRGSPMTLSATYSVSSPTVATLETPSLSVSGALQDSAAPQGSALITLASPGAIPPTVRTDAGYASISYVSSQQSSPGAVGVTIDFVHPTSLGTGVYSENVAMRVCYDFDCRREVNGSPLILQTTYTVASMEVPEDGVAPLPYLSRTTLSHDVVDAEYSAALDAIVMVSAKPTSSLYVYETATGTERELRLNKAPTAVAVSPDGLAAAVGHDALITIVELTSIGQPDAPAPVLLDLTTEAFDLIFDGRGFVHAFPRADQFVDAHSVEIATNIERLGVGLLRAGTRAKLHPSGDFVYTADNGVSPSDIAKFDIRAGIAEALYDSPYHGDYEMCGDLWLKQDGSVIYTKCGNTFRTSTTRSEDMLYNGGLQLSASQTYGYQIDSLSQAEATHELMLLEADWYQCNVVGYRCYTHLGLYESEFLNRTAVYSLAPIAAGGSTYSQRGLFVFHSADGLHRYMISRLFGFSGDDQPYYLTVIQ